MIVIEVIFWVSIGLIVYAHVGYPLLMALLSALFGEPVRKRRADDRLPTVTLIVPAHDEAEVIERRVENALALDYPRDRVELVVASDGSTDRTVELARAAGADLVLDLPRGGKVAALNAAARQAQGTIFAFSDANAYWHQRALRRLVARFEDPEVGYVCGRVRFSGGEGGNQEGLYWRYEMAVRRSESRLAGITGGNGAIYAVRPEAYVELEPDRGQDLSFPFELTKGGWRAVYEPEAMADERMAPTVEGEFQRKRRMMWGLWDAMLRYGMLKPRGYTIGYAFQIYSHRLLRYLTPFLHVIALLANAALLSQGDVYSLTISLQLCLLAAAGLGRYIPLWPLQVAYYYVTVTAAIAAGFWDRFRAGEVPIGWEKVEGTR